MSYASYDKLHNAYPNKKKVTCICLMQVNLNVWVFFQIPYFEDVGTMTLQFMDTLFQRDNLQKSQFFKGLPKIIEKLPKVLV